MERHGSESYFVIGEGLLGETVGGRDRTLAAADEAARPAVPLLADGPERSGAPAPGTEPEEAVGGDRRGRGRRVADPGRVHVSRPVRRPRPDVRQDERHARRERLAGRAPPGALAEPRPRLALRRRSRGSGIGEVLRGGRHPPEDGEDPRSGRAFPGWTGSISPEAPAPPRRRSGRRSSRTRGTTRTSPSPRRTSR